MALKIHRYVHTLSRILTYTYMYNTLLLSRSVRSRLKSYFRRILTSDAKHLLSALQFDDLSSRRRPEKKIAQEFQTKLYL